MPDSITPDLRYEFARATDDGGAVIDATVTPGGLTEIAVRGRMTPAQLHEAAIVLGDAAGLAERVDRAPETQLAATGFDIVRVGSTFAEPIEPMGAGHKCGNCGQRVDVQQADDGSGEWIHDRTGKPECGVPAQAERMPFVTWLKPHQVEESALGDLAVDLLDDWDAVNLPNTLDAYLAHLTDHDAIPAAIDTLRHAWARYERETAPVHRNVHTACPACGGRRCRVYATEDQANAASDHAVIEREETELRALAQYIADNLSRPADRGPGITVVYPDDKRPPTDPEEIHAALVAGNCWLSWMDDHVLATLRQLGMRPA